MTANDIIFYTPEDKTKVERSLRDSLRQVLLSMPFAADFHQFKSKIALIKRLINNRLPTILFKLFAEDQNLNIESVSTNFWQSSLYDFAYQKTGFKIIHQLVETENILSAEKYLSLPALVPNRFDDDIWEKQKEIPIEVDKIGFLFTFMHGDSEVISDIKISPEILKFLLAVEKKFGHWQGTEQPFAASDFWDAFAEKGELPHVSLESIPSLIITGVAREEEFRFFADTDDKTNHGYRLYQGQWYEMESGGGLSFCGGLIKTRIKNATCPMEALPSFKSIMWLAN